MELKVDLANKNWKENTDQGVLISFDTSCVNQGKFMFRS